MPISMVLCKPSAAPLLNLGIGRLNMELLRHPKWHKEKVVIILGATGTGKSRLSIDIASRFPAEIINSDKIQAHHGLDIATNKITEDDKKGIPHHLLGTIHPNAEFTAEHFCDMALSSIESISARRQLPIIVGGSNSYIEALISSFDIKFRSRYECCFLWVDVAMTVLRSFLSDRVDKMVQQGLVEEVRKFFDPNADYSRGIRKAIGVPELDKYFRTEPFLNEHQRVRLLEEAIEEIKSNNRKLALRQLGKINRLQNLKGWNLHRLDATQVFRKQGREANEAWEELVAGPGTRIVSEFLDNFTSYLHANMFPSPFETRKNGVPARKTTVAAAGHCRAYSCAVCKAQIS